MREHKNGDELAEKTKEIIRLVEDTCIEKGVELKNVAKDLYGQMRRAEETAMGKVSSIASVVNSATQAHPWPYIGVAAALGVLIGLLLPFRR